MRRKGNNIHRCKNLIITTNKINKFKTVLGNSFTRKIGQYDLENNLIKEFSSIVEAAKELNIGKVI
jgi:hypothetical protein